MMDRIIVMRDGRILEIGSYSELMNDGGAFAEFIETYLQECNDDDDEDPESENEDIIIMLYDE
jgi:ABC-type proline/glycine betaine transport system ATPase subunit